MKIFRFIFSLIFRVIVFIRNILYDNGIFNQKTINCPVISVGNLSLGGTGKTPFVEYISEYFIKNNKFPAIICKGYGRTDKDIKVVENNFKNEKCELTSENFGDEPFMLLENLSKLEGKCLIATGENKTRTAKLVCSKFKPDLIIIDDGFQHRSLARDLDLVISSQSDGQHLIPLGKLREPRENLKRADLIIINEKFNESDNIKIKQVYKTVKIKYEVKGIFNYKGDSLKKIQNQKISLFCGIGDPESFRKTVEQQGLSVTVSRNFKDHHNYLEKDIKKIITDFHNTSAEAILTTQKDFIRLKNSELVLKNQGDNIYKNLLYQMPLFYIRISVQITHNPEILKKELESILRIL